MVAFQDLWKLNNFFSELFYITGPLHINHNKSSYIVTRSSAAYFCAISFDNTAMFHLTNSFSYSWDR